MFRIAAGVGVVTVTVAIWLTWVFPRAMGPLPAGMKTPIIAFELARSSAEVETMFGDVSSPERVRWRRAMDAGNYQDFLFLVVYGLFFMTFCRALIESGGSSAQWGRRIAAIPSSMDAMENVQLLAITANLGGEYSDALSHLGLFTWAKWIGIALIVASWVPALWSRGALGRFTASMAVLTCASTVAAFFARGVAAELMAAGVGLTVLSALTFAFRSPKA